MDIAEHVNALQRVVLAWNFNSVFAEFHVSGCGTRDPNGARAR